MLEESGRGFPIRESLDEIQNRVAKDEERLIFMRKALADLLEQKRRAEDREDFDLDQRLDKIIDEYKRNIMDIEMYTAGDRGEIADRL